MHAPAGLASASDPTIWGYAKARGHTVLTADSDFVTLAKERGFPPKVVHLERCDFPLRVIENLLRTNAIRFAEFEADAAADVLSIRL